MVTTGERTTRELSTRTHLTGTVRPFSRRITRDCECGHVEPSTAPAHGGTTTGIRALDALDPVGANCRSGHHRLGSYPWQNVACAAAVSAPLSMETDHNVVPSERNITTYLPQRALHRASVLGRGRCAAHLGVPLRGRRKAPGRWPAAGAQACQARAYALGHCCSSGAHPRARGVPRGARRCCASRAVSARASASPPDRPHHQTPDAGYPTWGARHPSHGAGFHVAREAHTVRRKPCRVRWAFIG